MKPLFFFLALFSPLFVVSCSNSSDAKEGGGKATSHWSGSMIDSISLLPAEQDMTTRATLGGYRLFAQIDSGETDDNCCFSPLSASCALALAANGAVGDTRLQLWQALGLGGYSDAQLNSYFYKLLTALPRLDTLTTFAAANSLWVREGLGLNPAYSTTMASSYLARVRELPFDETAVDSINRWCSQHTAGRIPTILQSINSNAMLFLLNALYFKGDWKYTFDTQNTRSRDFTSAGGKVAKVKMMSQTTVIPYYEDESLQAVDLPFGRGMFRMTFLLPSEGSSTRALAQRLAAGLLSIDTDLFVPDETQIEIPRFTLHTEIMLNSSLMALGALLPFDAQLADFSHMTQQGLFISMVKQKTFIKVDETGAEAAAVTGIGMETTSIDEKQPHTFCLNRPFLFLIRESHTGVLLFVGRVGMPNDN